MNLFTKFEENCVYVKSYRIMYIPTYIRTYRTFGYINSQALIVCALNIKETLYDNTIVLKNSMWSPLEPQKSFIDH